VGTVREKLLYAIGVEVDGAKKGLKDFRSSVLEAEGVTGKLKAGFSSAMTSLTQNAGFAATAIGTTLVAAGVKAVGAFTETAKAAIDLSTATGLNVEAASRWIAVGDDYQVTAEALATGLGKVAKTLDADKWAKYGIATRDASGNARDVNDILLDSFDTLSKVTNETERARIGQELFGKGYQSLTPLLGHTREEYEKMLATQMKGQVITAEEAKKAEKTRLAMDNLHDSLQEITLATGQLLSPALAELADDLAAVAQGAEDAGEAIGKVPGLPELLKKWNPVTGFLGTIKEGFEQVGKSWHGTTESIAGDADRMGDSVNDLGPDAENAARGIGALGPAGQAAAAGIDAADDKVTALERAVKDGGDAWGGYFGAVGRATQAVGGAHGDYLQMKDDLEAINEEARNNALGILADAAKAVGDAVNDAFSDVRDNLDLGDLLDDITDQFAKVAEAQKHVTEDGDEGVRNYNRSVRDLQRQLLRLLDSIDGIPPDKKVAIAAEIQRGSIDDLYRILGELEKGVVVPVSFSMPKTPAFSSLNGVFSPGTTPSGPIYNDPTAFAGKTSGYVDNRNITIINPIGSTPTTQYVDSQTDFRRNGAR
jgi:hypothetical protein